MSFTKGYYSIVQYCPDPSRLEAVNIGVALLCPDLKYLKAKFGRSRTRITQLFGRQDWEFVKLQESAIEARLAVEHPGFDKLEDFEAYISRRANALVLTSPRPVKVQDPERELRNLLHRLVGPKGDRAQQIARISKELENILRSEGVASGLQRNVTVHPPSLPKAIKVPFAYRNGRMNLIEPVQFAGQSSGAVFNKASVLAVEGEFLAEYRDPKLGDLDMVVVAKFASDQEQDRQTAAAVFDMHKVKMYTFGALQPLIEDIRQHTN